MIRTALLLLLTSWLFTSCQSIESTNEESQNLAGFIDPFIGTTREGNQIPGPRTPFGMIHPNPVNIGELVPQATNYVFGEPEIFGIAINNLVGVGCSNFGSVLLKPAVGDFQLAPYRTKYSDEFAEPGYYSVFLDDYQVKTEITTTDRSAIFQFHYPKGKGNIFFDLSRRNEADTTFMINVVNLNEIEGYKTDGSFCSAGDEYLHRVYFVAQVNVPANNSGVVKENEFIQDLKTAQGEEIGAVLSYDFESETALEIRVGISYVSIENARENLEKETSGKTFDEIRTENIEKWEEKLARIEVKGDNDDYKTMFYTAMYHTMSHPNILNDINGEYRAMGNHEIKQLLPGETRYTVFSLWDTYRTLHPFLTLAFPEIQEDMTKSIMGMYYENGWLPQWELISRETLVMIGDPATIVLSDTYLKGIEFDSPDSILKAMLNNAENYYYAPQWGYNDVAHIRRSIVPYLENNGWIPYDAKHKYGNRHWATVATTQEYNLADWNIAEFSRMLGKDSIADVFNTRSLGYRNLYNPETMFFQQRWQNGDWVEPFNPFAGRWPPQEPADEVYDMPWPYSGGPGYCEGMAWHYNFFVPHDIHGVIELMGGNESFTNRLQTLFDEGYYEPTNEPDIAFPFLFNYVKGEEWRTQKTVLEIINNEYGIGTDGIPGNDDTGTMSAWLIFAMMGIYPDCPGNTDYQLTIPAFDEVILHLNTNYYPSEKLTITRKGWKENKYINKVMLDESQISGYRIDHNQLVNGKKLHYTFE